MTDTEPTIFLTCDGFAASQRLTELAGAKAARLLREADLRPHRVCVHVRRDRKAAAHTAYAASATAEKNALIHVTHAFSAEAETAIVEALAKLEQNLLSPRRGTREATSRRMRLEPITDFLKI